LGKELIGGRAEENEGEKWKHAFEVSHLKKGSEKKRQESRTRRHVSSIQNSRKGMAVRLGREGESLKEVSSERRGSKK